MKKKNTEPLRSLPRDMSLKYSSTGSSSMSSVVQPIPSSHHQAQQHVRHQMKKSVIATGTNNTATNSGSNSGSSAGSSIGGVNKQYIDTKSLPQSLMQPQHPPTSTCANLQSTSQSYNTAESLGILNAGPLAIVRGIDNRNSGGSSSVATPNSPQQSPLSLCSSGGGGGTTSTNNNNNNSGNQAITSMAIVTPVPSSAHNINTMQHDATMMYPDDNHQIYNEDGLNEEELRQIANRQQMQIQRQKEEIAMRQQKLHNMRIEMERNSRTKIAPSVFKLKEIYEQQELKLKNLRNLKNQALQNKANYNTLKNDVTNFNAIISNKSSELMKLEKQCDELREFLLKKNHRVNTTKSTVPPALEAFIRQKNQHGLLVSTQATSNSSNTSINSTSNSSGSSSVTNTNINNPMNCQYNNSIPISSTGIINQGPVSQPLNTIPPASYHNTMIPASHQNMSVINDNSNNSAFKPQLKYSSNLHTTTNTTTNLTNNVTSCAGRSSSNTPIINPQYSHDTIQNIQSRHAPPLPEHGYQKGKQQSLQTAPSSSSSHTVPVISSSSSSGLKSHISNPLHTAQQQHKRPPPPSYTDATIISAKYSMLLAQAARNNMRTPTSSPPVLRRLSIVGLPSGKMPSRFASRNTINNIYTKKSNLETLEKYKKTASEIYKAQLNKFKSSSTDDIRVGDDSLQQQPSLATPSNKTQTAAAAITATTTDQPQQSDANSLCSSSSSLSLPEELAADLISTQQQQQQQQQQHLSDNTAQQNNNKENITSTTAGNIVGNSTTCSENDNKDESTGAKSVENVELEDFDDDDEEERMDSGNQFGGTSGIEDDFDDQMWQESIKRAMRALDTKPTKHILKKPEKLGADLKLKEKERTGRKAYFHPHSLLLDAALEAEFDLVKEMADKVDDISQATDEGITALHNAVCSGREDIVEFLLERGAHVNAGDTDGWTPLHCAASCNNLGMARLLVERGASLFAMSISDGEIPYQKCETDSDWRTDEDGNAPSDYEEAECEQYLIAQQEMLGSANDNKVYALFSYEAQNEDEISIKPNQILKIINREPSGEPGWFQAQLIGTQEHDVSSSIKCGLVPKAYVSLYPLILPPFNESEH